MRVYISVRTGAKKITKLQCPSIDYPWEIRTEKYFKVNEFFIYLQHNVFHVGRYMYNIYGDC